MGFRAAPDAGPRSKGLTLLRLRSAFARPAAALLAVVILAGVAFAAPARENAVSRVKRYQARLLMREPMREKKERREREKELRELARELKKHGRRALIRRGDKIRSEVKDEDLRLGRGPFAPGVSTAARFAEPARGSVSGPPSPNVRANDTAGDFSSEGQCETSIASYGDYMVAAWNDSKGFRDGSGQTQGWATSVDGGLTWTDQGTPPLPTGVTGWKWTSDPVVVVNPNTGAFYYAALGDASTNLNGIGVLKGRFTGTTFNWSVRSASRTSSYTVDFLDKEWIAVDPASGKVYVTCTNFTGGTDQIEFQYADSSLASWSTPIKISAQSENGYVQGSRPIVGPGGVVYVTYYAIGLVDVDYVRFCRSTNGGQSFSAPVDAVAFYSNWGTGAPGFNRDNPIPNFPSVAVDMTNGPHAGRVYLAWEECLNWYDDLNAIGTAGNVSEVEPNETSVTATPITPGVTVRGSLSSTSDFDYYRVHLSAGQTFMAFADSSVSGATFSLRMIAVDGLTRLAWNTAASSDINAGYLPGWLWTAPADGDYYLRVASQVGSGSYTLVTGLASHGSERGDDQRNVFVSHSDNGGGSWSVPVRVDDAPVGYDGWLPEVAVDSNGDAFCAWYDWRDAPAATSGGQSNVYLARSSDGGQTWTTLGRATDAISDWTNCLSYIAPNQGDYLSLHAAPSKLTVCWSDARGGTPDVYVSVWPLAATSTTVTVVSATASPGRVDLEWSASPPDGFRATVYRTIAGAGAWTALDTVTADPAGRVAFSDTAVTKGTTYTYRLGVIEGGSEFLRGEVTVTVPSGLALAMRGVFPNPTNGVNAWLAFTLPLAEPATVAVYDLEGRLVDSRRLTGLAAAEHVIPFELWPSARSGVYLVRITQRGRSLTSRVAIVR